MFAALRARMFVALSLTCAASTLSCKKTDDATPVENEGPKKKKAKPKPEPAPKKKKTWEPEEAAVKGGCPHKTFCSTAPEIASASDASALSEACGSSAKIPDGAASASWVGRTASLNPTVTEKERKDEPDACCYTYSTGPCGKGRPMRDGDALVIASPVARTGWTDVEVDVGGVEPARAAHFRRIALLEHGSIAAFANLSLELMALGAPADLVHAAHVAALDEIRHARVFFALASKLSGEDVGPSPLALPARGPVDVERLLIETVVEGCVGETLGSLLFFEQARSAEPALAALYRQVAEEEATHAELAFRIVRFLVGDDPRRAALARDAAFAAPLAAADPRDQRVLDRAFREVVAPAFGLLSCAA